MMNMKEFILAAFPRVVMGLLIAFCFAELCACGKEIAETRNVTENATEQETQSEVAKEISPTEESSTEKPKADETEQEPVKQEPTKKDSYAELDKMLEEINTDIEPGTTGCGMASIKVAAHLLNWGVGTGMGTDEIKDETVSWLSDKGNSEQVDFSYKLASVYDAYHKLLGSDAKELLEEAGCDDAAYPWSDSPVEPIEAIVEVVQLPDPTSVGDREFPGPDVAELVNLKGEETTVYLLADGRYMDRTSSVYIYDRVDTWTDASGVEWNEAVK